MLLESKSRWVPISAAARELGISRQAVRQQIDTGSLAGEYVSGTWLVSVASIEARKVKVGRKRR